MIDNSVYIQQGTEDFNLLSAAVTVNSYTTTINLIPGVTYQFKITARNAVGSSVQSETI